MRSFAHFFCWFWIRMEFNDLCVMALVVRNKFSSYMLTIIKTFLIVFFYIMYFLSTDLSNKVIKSTFFVYIHVAYTCLPSAVLRHKFPPEGMILYPTLCPCHSFVFYFFVLFTVPRPFKGFCILHPYLVLRMRSL